MRTVNMHEAKIRFGVLKGQFKIPDDFDTMMQEEIEEMFPGPEE